ncbi:MAG: tRNA pseudouridine(38-40) synthase TruA [Saprospiraceae bacterium]|nr:tRNA pseudouridine(38-40) synthase TruA [Saprospiraceae bacterium]
MRYFVRIKYNGTHFHGWQSQKNTPDTVQGKIEDALAIFLPEKPEIVGCGRTDSGVHASDYFFHFDTEHKDPALIQYKLNSILPNTIAVEHIIKVHDDAHTRFDASLRAYEYHLLERRDPFREFTSYFLPTLNRLDFDDFQKAAALITKYEDFEAFCKNGSDEKTKKCTIYKSQWRQTENGLVYEIEANRFLRGMIRLIVGMCINVARGQITLDQVEHALETKSRLVKDWSVPARGLFLCHINYDYIQDNIYVPITSSQ